MEALTSLYPWTKALHIVSMVAWMAGLFYLPRLFVHHAERGTVPGEPAASFEIMEAKLMRLIMTPAMLATWVFGLALLATPGVVDWDMLWIWPKLIAVVTLTWFHHWLGQRRRDFVRGANTVPGSRYRLMNELPTLALALIVVMVVVKPF